MKKNKRLTIIVITFIATALSLLLFHSYIKPIYNFRLERFVQNFSEIPLPEEAKLTGKRYKYFGLMEGSNSNHCDYHASMLIQTAMSKKELDKHYSQYSIPPAIPDGIRKPVNILIHQPWDEYSSDKDYEKTRYSRRYQVDASAINDSIFVIEATDWNYDPKYPICH